MSGSWYRSSSFRWWLGTKIRIKQDLAFSSSTRRLVLPLPFPVPLSLRTSWNKAATILSNPENVRGLAYGNGEGPGLWTMGRWYSRRQYRKSLDGIIHLDGYGSCVASRQRRGITDAAHPNVLGDIRADRISSTATIRKQSDIYTRDVGDLFPVDLGVYQDLSIELLDWCWVREGSGNCPQSNSRDMAWQSSRKDESTESGHKIRSKRRGSCQFMISERELGGRTSHVMRHRWNTG